MLLRLQGKGLSFFRRWSRTRQIVFYTFGQVFILTICISNLLNRDLDLFVRYAIPVNASLSCQRYSAAWMLYESFEDEISTCLSKYLPLTFVTSGEIAR